MSFEGKSPLGHLTKRNGSRLDRIRSQSQRQVLTEITKHLSSLKIEQTSATITTVSNRSSIVNDHTKALRGEATRICRTIQNPVQRAGFEFSSSIAVQDLASDLSTDQKIISWPPSTTSVDNSSPTHFDERPHRYRQQIWTKRTLRIGDSITQSIFGAIYTTRTTRLLRSRFVDDDDAWDDEDSQIEQECSFRIMPAQWLLKLGFRYAYQFSALDSSTTGWQCCLKPINLVPDDASIFEFCKRGNIEEVRNLIAGNLASVRDVDSNGTAPFHVGQPGLRSFVMVLSQVFIYLTPVISLRQEVTARSFADS